MMGKNRVVKSFLVMLLFFAVNTFSATFVQAGQTELSETEATARSALEEAIEELSGNAEEYQNYVDMMESYLPEESVVTLNEIISVAQLDISTEEKVDEVIEISQRGCALFAQIWFLFWFLGLLLGFLAFPLPPIFFSIISLLSDIGFWGFVLCLFGFF